MYDISHNMFYAHWPSWLRWALFIPSAIVCCVLFSFIFKIAVGSNSDMGSVSHGWYNLISSGIFGAAFVGVSAYVAPKKQLEVSVVMLSVFSLILGMLWVREYDLGFYSQSKDLLYYAANSIVAIIGGVASVIFIKKDIDDNKQ